LNDKVQEIRENAEYRKNHSQLARDILYLLSELDAAKKNIEQITGGRLELLNENLSLQQQLDAVKQENERLKAVDERESMIAITIRNENHSLQQRLKQAVEQSQALYEALSIVRINGHAAAAKSIVDILRKEAGKDGTS
jgi:Skp family chaperone for outer membrane proteins